MTASKLLDLIDDRFKDPRRREYSELKNAFMEGYRREKCWQTADNPTRFYSTNDVHEDIDGASFGRVESEMRVRGRIAYLLNDSGACDAISGTASQAAMFHATESGIIQRSPLVRKKILDSLSCANDFTYLIGEVHDSALMKNSGFQQDFVARLETQLSSPAEKRKVTQYIQENYG